MSGLVDPMASLRGYLAAEKSAATRKAYIADFSDLKLPDAISHSRSVATLAEEASRLLGLPGSLHAELKRAVERAAGADPAACVARAREFDRPVFVDRIRDWVESETAAGRGRAERRTP